MNTALYVLRCAQSGITYAYLRHMSIGMVYDVFTEAGNDGYDYPYRATQADMDRL